MTREECAKAWKTVVECYHRTCYESPIVTANLIVKEIGYPNAKEVFATIAKIKKYDGRIYGSNRDWTETVLTNPDSLIWESNNPLLYAGLDEIHTAHINQIITELRKMED